jgi:hypothetical protein
MTRFGYDIKPPWQIRNFWHLLFYNGRAILEKNLEHFLLVQKLLSSRLFLFYIKNTSKPFSSTRMRGYMKCDFSGNITDVCKFFQIRIHLMIGRGG